MITCTSDVQNFKTITTNGDYQVIVDASKDKGGNEAGFRPQEMLEVAVASSMNIWIRMHAQKEGLPLKQVVTKVSLDRTSAPEAVFKYSVKLEGDLDEKQQKILMQAIQSCPVRETLMRKVSFQYSHKL